MADCVSNAAELVELMRLCADEKNVYCKGCKFADIDNNLCMNVMVNCAADEIERLKKEFSESLDYARRLLSIIDEITKERDAAVADLEKCMHYAKPKNNNVCNFCKKDAAEYKEKCAGWYDPCECDPEWRGVVKEEEDATERR